MRNVTKKGLVLLTVVAVIGFGAYAFADGGMGPGMRGGWDHHGPGRHHGGYGCSEYGGHMMGDLSDEDIQKIDEQREAFFKSTEDLRRNIYQKKLALQSEFAKKNPDAKKAADLQKEISDIRAQLDQKRIEHILEMRKINPNAGRGFSRGFRGYGPMKGYGASYGGSCWR